MEKEKELLKEVERIYQKDKELIFVLTCVIKEALEIQAFENVLWQGGLFKE